MCDGPGGGTSVNDQYECASDCQSWQGGWCGNGSIDNYEDCDISESIDKKRETLRGEGVPNVSSMSDRHVEILYDSTCIFCSFDVQDWGDVGLGCYVDDSCEKGKFLRWNPETEEWECVPFDPPLYDYCCVNNNNPEKSGTSLHDLAYDVIYPSISDPDNNNFKCDEICQDYGKVCIGVGLMDSDTNYCKSVKHHEPPLITCADGSEGKDCTNDVNVEGNDCRTLYRQNSNHCMNCANNQGYWFTIGGTACYCY